MNLSEHFTLEELTHTEHRELENIPNETELANLKRLAEFLERVKTVLGGKPIMVNSAFRSKAVNDAVGSKDTSQHRIGCAADIRVPGITPERGALLRVEAGESGSGERHVLALAAERGDDGSCEAGLIVG